MRTATLGKPAVTIAGLPSPVDLDAFAQLDTGLIAIERPVGRQSAKRMFRPQGFDMVMMSASAVGPSSIARAKRNGVPASRLLMSYYEWDYKIAYTPHTYYKHIGKLRMYGIKNVIQMDESCWFGEPWEKRVENMRRNFLFAHIAQHYGLNVLPNFNVLWDEDVCRHCLPDRVPSICIDGAHVEHEALYREDQMMLDFLCREFGTRSAIMITGKRRLGSLKWATDVMDSYGGAIYFCPSEASFLCAGSRASRRWELANNEPEPDTVTDTESTNRS